MPRAASILLVAVLTMQSIAKDPQLITTYEGTDIKPDPDAAIYLKFCPFDRQLQSCWLNWESRRDDPHPSYIDGDGYEHFHDITQLKRQWLCECGHLWIEEWNNGACWCGWAPW